MKAKKIKKKRSNGDTNQYICPMRNEIVQDSTCNHCKYLRQFDGEDVLCLWNCGDGPICGEDGAYYNDEVGVINMY